MPEDWSIKKVGDIGQVIGGGTPSTKDKLYYGGEIPWITPKDLSDHKFTFIERGERNITKIGLNNSSARLLPEGTVLFTSRAPIGYVAIAKNAVSTNQGFKSIICNPQKAYNKFIYYALKYYKDKIENVASGSTFKEISSTTLKKFEILLPPLDEQKVIADRLFSIDSKRELNHQMNKTLEKIGQALFKHWFIDFEFPNEEGKPYKSSGGEMVYNEDFGNEIPKGWEVKPLDKIADFLNGLALQKYPQKDEKYLPVIKIKELRQGITDASDKASPNISKQYIVEDGAILFSWSGSLEVCIWCGGKGALNQHLFKVTSKLYSKWFYYFWIKQYLVEFRHIAAGKATTMGHIQRHHLSETFGVVPLESIMTKINKLMEPLLNKIIINNIQSRELGLIRDALLPKLMSGEIRVKAPETEVN